MYDTYMYVYIKNFFNELVEICEDFMQTIVDGFILSIILSYKFNLKCQKIETA